MTTQIKLMADYNCFLLWNMNEISNIDPNTLPLSIEIKQRLENWAYCYDVTLNLDDPLSSGFPTAEAGITFEEEGKALWKILQETLGSEYIVFYFSQTESKLLDPTELFD
jgi:hypothetical protein